jgi:hypothetical protein
VGLPPDCGANPLDADLSIISYQADKLFQLHGSASGLLHLEMETSWAGDVPDDLLLYNVLAHHRYGGPVYTVLLLLRREAWSPELTGVLRRLRADGSLNHEFRYTPVRLWELPCEPLMSGPLGTMPLALLTDEAQANLPNLIMRVDQRLQQEAATPKVASDLELACGMLLGLRLDQGHVNQLFKGAKAMRESSTYQMILDEGRIQTLRDILLRLGKKHVGSPRPEDEAAVKGVTEAGRLERMIDRVETAADWNELLATQ